MVEELGGAVEGSPAAFEDDPAFTLANLFDELDFGPRNLPFFGATPKIYWNVGKFLDHGCRIKTRSSLTTVFFFIDSFESIRTVSGNTSRKNEIRQ